MLLQDVILRLDRRNYLAFYWILLSSRRMATHLIRFLTFVRNDRYFWLSEMVFYFSLYSASGFMPRNSCSSSSIGEAFSSVISKEPARLRNLLKFSIFALNCHPVLLILIVTRPPDGGPAYPCAIHAEVRQSRKRSPSQVSRKG
jgi:hypothetical protein